MPPLPDRVLVATSNPHKAEEIRDILHLPGVRFTTLAEQFPQGIPACSEDHLTFAENAAQKARFYAERSGLTTLADDSGLEVDALDGRPGVHSARWQGEDTPYPIKNVRLLELLRDVPEEARTARFVCVVALADPDGPVELARGTHEGRIAPAIRGEGGFGYDPVFFSPELGATFGELPADRKNQVSHRARALQALRGRLLAQAQSPSRQASSA